MTNHKEILRLKNLKMEHQQIADACSCSVSTVKRTLKHAGETGIDWTSIKNVPCDEVTRMLHVSNHLTPPRKTLDYPYLQQELSKSGVTLNLLWLEYCEQCRLSGETPYRSTQFNKLYRDYLQKTKATMHLEHKRGDIMEVDWAGTTLTVIERTTGKPAKAYIFVAVLPWSGYSYLEAFLSMDQEAWITAHINAYTYFGGASRILVPDNLKTGVIRNGKDDTIINKTYLELAEHYGTAVLPARVRSPKDKASVEGVVGNITTQILAKLRNQQYLSLFDLNEDLHHHLNEFNTKPFQKKEGSRSSRFIEEQPFLFPLPKTPYELAVWRVATVQYNYHVSVEHKNYSCPYEYIRKKVDVRMTRNVVELFYQGTRIASHPRLYDGLGSYSTTMDHMPPEHRKYLTWNGDRFRKWARKMGENTFAVADFFLINPKVEQQGYKACMGLLKLGDTYSQQQLESACKKLLQHTSKPSLHGVRLILKSEGEKKIVEEHEENMMKTSKYGITRGPDYYKMGDL